MSKKKKCEHDWEKIEEKVIADNPKFNYKKQFKIIRKKCKSCGDTQLLDYVSE